MNKLIPGRVRIHNWRLRLDCLPTLENLVTLCVDMANTTCPLCLENTENREHLFVKCRLSSEIRTAINRWWNFFPLVCGSVNDLFNIRCPPGSIGTPNIIKVVVIQAYCWTIWKGRNDCQDRLQETITNIRDLLRK